MRKQVSRKIIGGLTTLYQFLKVWNRGGSKYISVTHENKTSQLLVYKKKYCATCYLLSSSEKPQAYSYMSNVLINADLYFTVDLIQKGKHNPKRTVQMVSDLTQVSRACSSLKDKLAVTQEYIEDILVSMGFMK